jgi:hypothetical protein
MSDLSTNPGHTPCGRGFLCREDACLVSKSLTACDALYRAGSLVTMLRY